MNRNLEVYLEYVRWTRNEAREKDPCYMCTRVSCDRCEYSVIETMEDNEDGQV